MKKWIYIHLLVIFASYSHAQQFFVYVENDCADVNVNSVSISGGTYNTSVSNTGLSQTKFYLKNTTGSSQSVKIKRLKICVPANWQDGLCWGNVCQVDPGLEGGCYTAPQMFSNPWTSPDVTIEDDSLAELKVDVAVSDPNENAHYRYYFMSGNIALDSVDLEINGGCTLAISDLEQESDITLFPNPANGQLTVTTTGLSGNFTIRISDVLGKIVYSDEAGPVKKIDTGDFKNGVYLVSVLEKGTVLQTRRVIIKH